MGRTKRADQKTVPGSLPFSNITAASANNAQMADSKSKAQKTHLRVDQNGMTHVKTGISQSASSRSKQPRCHPDTENDLVNGFKQCAISDPAALKKKQKEKEEQEIQNLINFIEGKDSSKENSVPGGSKKPKKKKKKTAAKPDENSVPNSNGNVMGQACKGREGKKGGEKKDIKAVDKKEGEIVDKKEGKNGEKKEGKKEKPNGTVEGSDGGAIAKTTAKPCKKAQRKACKAPTQEDLEIQRLLQFIEGDDTEKQGKGADNSDQNNNDHKKKKSKKKKAPKEFDFNALKDNTHLEAKMIDEILKNPKCVAEYRLFKPKQVALLFSQGHNEHWEKFPECDGRLQALEESRDGPALCDPGNKQLRLVMAELRAERGKNITKQNLIDALVCHAYLKCDKCSYRSRTITLQ